MYNQPFTPFQHLDYHPNHSTVFCKVSRRTWHFHVASSQSRIWNLFVSMQLELLGQLRNLVSSWQTTMEARVLPEYNDSDCCTQESKWALLCNW